MTEPATHPPGARHQTDAQPPGSAGGQQPHGDPVRKSTRAPERNESPDDDAESGRGLLLVHALAHEVTDQQVPGDGKVVCASVIAPPRYN